MKRKILDIKVKKNLRGIEVISSDESILAAAKFLEKNKIESTVVIHNNSVVGIVTEKDIFKYLAIDNIDKIKDTPVSSIMSTKVICVDESYTLEECLYIMCKLNIHHLPIVNFENLFPVSMISLKQIAQIIIDDKSFEIGQLLKFIHGGDWSYQNANELNFRSHREISYHAN